MSKHTGRVKFFDANKGYGFIVPDDRGVNGGRDVFVHVTALKASGIQTLAEGQPIAFAITEHKGKPSAADLGPCHE